MQRELSSILTNALVNDMQNNYTLRTVPSIDYSDIKTILAGLGLINIYNHKPIRYGIPSVGFNNAIYVCLPIVASGIQMFFRGIGKVDKDYFVWELLNSGTGQKYYNNFALI